MDKPFRSHSMDFRIYAEDTDFMGIVYHANHLRFFERARTELLRANGLALTTMADCDTYFAIRDIRIRYCLPAYLDDCITIQSNCEQEALCSFLFTQVMHNQSNQKLSEATVQVVCVNGRLKPKRFRSGGE